MIAHNTKRLVVLTLFITCIALAKQANAQTSLDTIFVTAVDKTEAHPYFGMGFHRGFAMNGIEGDTLILVRDSLYIFDIQAIYKDPDFTTTFDFYTVPIGGGRNFYDEVIERKFISQGIWHVRATKTTLDTFYYASSDEPWAGGTLIVVDSLTSSVNQGYSTTIVGLSHAVPNPFNTETTIHFALEKPSELQLEIIDPLGRMVLSESLGGVASGVQNVRVNGASFVAGIYHYRIIASSGEDRQVMSGILQVLR